MNSTKVLFHNDIKEVKSYFGSQTASKLLILIAFILIFFGLSFIIYNIARQYLYIIRLSQDYAFVTADYTLRAIVLLLFWLGIGSSTVSSISFYLNKNKNLAYLLTLPVNTLSIISWQYLKTIFLNTILLSIILYPILLVFERGFIRGFGLGFYLSALGLLFALSSVTSALGGLLGALLLKLNFKLNLFLSLLGVAIFVLVLLLLFNFVFPTSLYRLALATPEDFQRIYSNLPLSNQWIPTNWLTELFTTRKPIYWLATIGLASLTTLLYINFQINYFLKTYLKINSASTLEPTGKAHQINFEKLSPLRSLLTKDLALLFRSPGELGYATFLFLLFLLFFGLFSKARIEPQMPQEWINMFITFAFAGLLFFTNTFLLRIAFPAMAKEGESLWYLYTLPLSRQKIWWSKIFYVLFLSTPFQIMAVAVWPVLTFASHNFFLLAPLSITMVILIAFIQAFLGLIRPNFAESSNSEKISTSFMGILTLAITMTLTLAIAIGINLQLQGSAGSQILIRGTIVLGFITILFLAFISRSQINCYKL